MKKLKIVGLPLAVGLFVYSMRIYYPEIISYCYNRVIQNYEQLRAVSDHHRAEYVTGVITEPEVVTAAHRPNSNKKDTSNITKKKGKGKRQRRISNIDDGGPSLTSDTDPVVAQKPQSPHNEFGSILPYAATQAVYADSGADWTPIIPATISIDEICYGRGNMHNDGAVYSSNRHPPIEEHPQSGDDPDFSQHRLVVTPGNARSSAPAIPALTRQITRCTPSLITTSHILQIDANCSVE